MRFRMAPLRVMESQCDLHSRLAQQEELGYNYRMIRPHRPHPWLLLRMLIVRPALAAVLAAAVVLCVCCTTLRSSDRSPLPTPSEQMTSPLPAPVSATAAFGVEGTATASPSAWTSIQTHDAPSKWRCPLRPWTSGGAVLLWVVVGIVLALGVALVVFGRHRHDK
jgi:hypothetical protein